MPVLTAIDVLGVQRFVFASNRLRDVVAASSLVDWATSREGALADLDAGGVLLAGGGNAILEFADLDRARRFTERYTRLLYDKAPGIAIVVAHNREHGTGELAQALGALQIDLAQAKLERIPAAPQLGLSVTAACRITGLPATGLDPQDSSVPLARSILRLRDTDVRKRTRERWQSLLAGKEHLAFPDEIDQMGRSRGDTSLVGVVHVDGNGIGTKITEWMTRCREEGLGDTVVREQYGAWSGALGAQVTGALRAVVERVAAAIDPETGTIGAATPELAFELNRDSDGRLLLPMRPILLGGDDLTFVCDGRIALDLAETALAAFGTEIGQLGAISATAGVALVAAHAPFDRAYELAEALCAHAKRRRNEKNDAGSWIDWHIGGTRPGESVESLRTRQFRAANLSFTCRPYPLGTAAGSAETWRWLAHTVLGQGSDGFRGSTWSTRRNKVKALRDAAREGPDAVRQNLEAWRAAAPKLALPNGIPDDGFFDGTRTPFLDAIELLDIHVPLGGGSEA